MPECPYCGRAYVDKTGLFSHALQEHRDAVLAHWVESYGLTPLPSGQQRLQEAAV